MSQVKGLKDEQLVLLVQTTGDSDSFSELIKRYQASFHAFLVRFTGNKSLAEDIAQESFIKSYQKINNFKGLSSFKTWLFSIGYREFLQQHRKSSAMDRMLTALKLNKSNELFIDYDRSIDLEKNLMSLSNIERAALLLCDAYGMSHSEAAIALETPLGSIKTYVKRARALMNEKIGNHYD